MDEAALIVSIVVAIGAFLGWLDNRLRITRSEYAFAVENDDSPDWYRIRNTGSRRVQFVEVDPASVSTFEISGIAMMTILESGASFSFGLKSSRGDLPAEITVMWGSGRKKRRTIPFSAALTK